MVHVGKIQCACHSSEQREMQGRKGGLAFELYCSTEGKKELIRGPGRSRSRLTVKYDTLLKAQNTRPCQDQGSQQCNKR